MLLEWPISLYAVSGATVLTALGCYAWPRLGLTMLTNKINNIRVTEARLTFLAGSRKRDTAATEPARRSELVLYLTFRRCSQ